MAIRTWFRQEFRPALARQVPHDPALMRRIDDLEADNARLQDVEAQVVSINAELVEENERLEARAVAAETALAAIRLRANSAPAGDFLTALHDIADLAGALLDVPDQPVRPPFGVDTGTVPLSQAELRHKADVPDQPKPTSRDAAFCSCPGGGGPDGMEHRPGCPFNPYPTEAQRCRSGQGAGSIYGCFLPVGHEGNHRWADVPVPDQPKPTCPTCGDRRTIEFPGHPFIRSCPDCVPDQPNPTCPTCGGAKTVRRAGRVGKGWGTRTPCPDCVPDQPNPTEENP